MTHSLKHPIQQPKHTGQCSVISDYALVLLWASCAKHGFTKRYAIATALGTYKQKPAGWPWTNTHTSVFNLFSKQGLLKWDKKTKLWHCGKNLPQYIETHFSDMLSMTNSNNQYNEAIQHNTTAKKTNQNIRINYKKQKQFDKIGKEFFFQH